MKRFYLLAAVLVISGPLLVAGCSSNSGSADGPLYKQSKSLPSLEVPPGLSQPQQGSAGMELPEGAAVTASEEATGQQAQNGGTPGVLPEQQNVRVVRAGQLRWLEVDAEPQQVWPKLLAFLKKQGLEIKSQDPAAGIIETKWAENLAGVKDSGLSGLFNKLLGSSSAEPTQDKYHLRLERGEKPGTTDIYITHYGVKQVVKSSPGSEEGEPVWEVEDPDPTLANEMLSRLMVSLGVPTKDAKQQVAEAPQEPPRATLEQDSDGPYLKVEDEFARAWRRTGLALDRIGFVVEDRDRANGIYYVRDVDQLKDSGKGSSSGWFGSLFSSDADKKRQEAARNLQVVVSREGEISRVEVKDKQGKRLDDARTKEILGRLLKQLR